MSACAPRADAPRQSDRSEIPLTSETLPGVDFTVGDGVAHVTLARLARGNALAPPVVETLLDAVAAAVHDPRVHTLVLRGRGRHFCTGFDLSDAESAGDGELMRRLVRVEQLLAALWHAPVRTVALAHGRTFGAGADIVAACDRRVATPDAEFAFPGARFGVVIGSRRLAVRLGEDVARRFVTEGETLSAAQAHAAGLLTDIVDEGALDAFVASLPPPVTDRATLAAMRAAMRPDQRDADLAALVRSTAVPGLAARIVRYRATLDASRSGSPP